MEKVAAQIDLMLIDLQSSEAVNLAGVDTPHRPASNEQKASLAEGLSALHERTREGNASAIVRRRLSPHGVPNQTTAQQVDKKACCRLSA